MVWPLPHLSYVVHNASPIFWALDRVSILPSHHRAFAYAVPSSWNDLPSLSLSFILKHCYLKEPFTDLLDHVRISY